MSTNHVATPLRVRTPVRSSSAASRPSPAAPKTATATTRTLSPRTAIASSPTPAAKRSLASPSTKGLIPPPATTSTLRSGATPSSRNPSPMARSSPSARGLSPRQGPATPIVRDPSRGSLVVSTPRAGTAKAAATMRTDSPYRGRLGSSGLVTSVTPRTASPNHTREMSAAQKALIKKDHDAMAERVGQLMAMQRPVAIPNGFRVDLSSEDDLRMAHLERIRVDPEICGSKRMLTANRALATHMSGIIGSSPLDVKDGSGDIQPRGKAQYPSERRKSSELVCGTRKEAADTAASSARTARESAQRQRATSASETAPWNKGPAPGSFTPQRSLSAQRNIRTVSPISFDPHAPLTPRAARPPSASHKHHDVFADKVGVDSRGVPVATPRAARTKTAETIRKEVAAAPPPELPPRKKPSIKQNPASTANSGIFTAPYGDPEVCTIKTTVGRRIVESLSSRKVAQSNPNAVSDERACTPTTSRKHTTASAAIAANEASNAAGTRSDFDTHSPEHTRRRVNTLRGTSSVGAEEGALSGTVEADHSPSRRFVAGHSAAALRPASSSNAPFATDDQEFHGVSRRSGAKALGNSPLRYSSPVEQARGSRSAGFYGKPSTAMKSVFSWE